MPRPALLKHSATELLEFIKSGELKPSHLTEIVLAHIEAVNPRLNAIVTLNEHAMDDAKRLDEKLGRGEKPGLLCGMPVGIKDVTPVAGLRTTFGSTLFAEHIPKQDALVVSRLRQADAIIIGKTNCPEFTAGGTTWNDVFGRTCNPWNPKLTPGGSTGGGAAALASSMILFAEGTDLGGSLRIPASFCGVVGLRPSPGLAPTYPSSTPWDVLEVTGPMARRAEDVALMLQVICGPTPLCPISLPETNRNYVQAVQNANASGLKIAYCPDLARIGIDPEVEKVCRAAAFEMQQSGAEVHEIELDLAFARKPYHALRGAWFVTHLRHHMSKADGLGVNVASNIKQGLTVTTSDLADAEEARTRLWHIFAELFETYDLLLTPCVAVPPFSVEQNYPETIAGKKMDTYIDWVAPTSILSMTSLPVACAPAGLDANQLPVGMQIVGPRLGEEAILAFAKVFQDVNEIGPPA